MNKVKITISAKTQIDMEENTCHGAEYKMNLVAEEPINDCCSEAVVASMLVNLLTEMTGVDVAEAIFQYRELEELKKTLN